jgi:hypothetical protein
MTKAREAEGWAAAILSAVTRRCVVEGRRSRRAAPLEVPGAGETIREGERHVRGASVP